MKMSDRISSIYESVAETIKRDRALLLRVVITALITGGLSFYVLAQMGYAEPDCLCEGMLYHRAKDFATSNGRWALRILLLLTRYLCAPSMIIFLHCICIALTSYLLIRFWKTDNPFFQIILTAALTAAPGAVNQLAYFYMSLVYCFAGLFSMLFIQTAHKKKLPNIIAGAVFMDIALGLYQPYVGYAAAGGLLTLILMLAGGKKLKEVFSALFSYAISGGAGCVLYILHVKIDLALRHMEGSERVQAVGVKETINNLPPMLKAVYARAFDFYFSKIAERWIFFAVFFILLVLLLLKLAMKAVKGKKSAEMILAAVLLMLFPLAANLCIFITPFREIDYLMDYQLVLIIPFFFAMVQNVYAGKKPADIFSGRSLVVLCGTAVCFVIAWTYVISANATYMCYRFSYDTAKEETRLILNRLYDDESFEKKLAKDEALKLMIVGFPEDKTEELQHNVYKLSYRFNGRPNGAFYEDMNGIHNVWHYFLLEFFGMDTASFSDGEYTDIVTSDEFKAMPVWPAAGSDAVIDGFHVVKLTDEPPLP